MPSLISKIKSSAYARYGVDKHSHFHRVKVLPKYSENSVGYLQHFGAMDRAHCTSRHCLVFLAVSSLDKDKKS